MNSLEKASKVFKEKYGIDHPMESPEFIRRSVRNRRCKSDLDIEDDICNKIKSRSSGDDSYLKEIISETLSGLNIRYKRDFKLGDFNYDYDLIDKQILIQVCPTNTHNNLFSFDDYGVGVPSMEHKTEAENAQLFGYECIHIFDWDNLFIILNMISARRKTSETFSVESLDINEFNLFFDNYCITNLNRRSTLHYGIFSDNALVAIAAFRKSTNKKYDWELTKYCEDTYGYDVNKIKAVIHKFNDDVKFNNVVTYVDQSKYSGREFLGAGFKYVETIYPQRVWSKGIDKILHNTIAGRKYDDIFHTNFNSNHSTYTQMVEHGWLPVYDCGKKVYLYGGKE